MGSFIISGSVFQFTQFRCLVRRCQTVYHLCQISIHNGIQTVQRQLDPVVGDAPLGEIIGADLLGTVSCADLAPPLLCLRIVSLCPLQPSPYFSAVTSHPDRISRYRWEYV